MIIKEIKVQGFKSFKDKTVIAIDEPVVGIVGPNGCGKSNIVDAMKWVLGEQSAKSLRGEAMYDVIYNGGASGKSSGMAEVSIKFSTQDGRIPPNYPGYSEIQITRRLYKNGDSEYLINKTPCRLKDIHDIIMGTGAGARAYAIVSQGHIEKFTTARPAERRFFVEEAAGITKYKVRKEAAERKIQSTGQNLLRISDIIKELQKQNTGLKRQSEAAHHYKDLKEQQRELDLKLSTSQFMDIKKKLKNDREIYDALNSEIHGIETEINKNELSIEDRKLATREEEMFLSSLQDKVYEGKENLQNAETCIKVRTKEIEEVESHLAGYKEYLSELNEKFKKLGEENLALGDGSLSAENEILKEKEAIAERENQYIMNKENLSLIRTKRDSHRESIISVLTSMSQARNKMHFVEESITSQEVRIEQKTKEKFELQEKLNNLEAKRKNFLSNLEAIKASRDSARQEREDLNIRLQKWKNELSSNQAEYDGLKSELSMNTSRLRSLEELRDNFDGYQDGVKSVMLDYPGKEKLHGIVGDNISVDPEYEIALESVLGERLQGVIINRHEEGSEAISHLRTSAGGRSCFLPLDMRTTSKYCGEDYKSLGKSGDAAFSGYLRDKVKIKNEFKQIADYLFNDVAIVKDLDSALRIWKEKKVRDTMVTPAGDVITPEGQISGGSVEAISSGILQKKREIAELNKKIDELEVKHALIVETIKRVQSQVEEAEEKEETLVRLGHSEDLKILDLEKDLAASEEEIERISKNIDLIDLEVERLKNQCNDFENQRLEAKKTIDENEVIKGNHDRKIKELEDREDELKVIIEEESEKITELKVNFASLKERVDSYRSRKERLGTDMSETDENIKSFSEKIKSAESRRATLLEEVKELNKQAENLVVLNEKAEETLKKRRERFQTENRDIIEVESLLKDLRQTFNSKQIEYSKIQIAINESDIKMDALTRETFEKFGDNLEEITKKLQEEDKFLKGEEDIEQAKSKLSKIKTRLEAMGEVNIMAIEEYKKVNERLAFLTSQKKDLEKAISSLEKTIQKINKTSMERFESAFNAINEQFKKVFPKLFKGGTASLVLTNPEDLLNSGVDIIVQPPGKKFQNINLFSGGEKALTAISLIFSIFLINPAPFCVLDEVDAPLDDSNIVRFNSIVREMSKNTQFVLITHNKRTMEVADKLYGITLEEEGHSRLVSVKFTDINN